VEVRGLDLTRPLRPEQASLLRHLFDRHHLLLPRSQGISGDDQISARSWRLLPPPPEWAAANSSWRKTGWRAKKAVGVTCRFALIRV
jgi:hypothetical protein